MAATERKRGIRTLSLSETSHRLLDDVGNASAYVDAIVQQHGREWTASLALLVQHGWRSAEIESSCEALAGYGLAGAGSGGDAAFLAAELARTGRDFFQARKVATRRMQRALEQLRTVPATAGALAVLAREYSLPNQALRSAIAGLESNVPKDG